MSLSVVVIGCGVIARTHVLAIARTPGVHVGALVDTVRARADEVADLAEAETGSRPAVHDTIAEAAAAGAQVAAICTPSGSHVDLAAEALAAGLHVVVEKPVDVGLEPARRLAALAKYAAADDRVVSVISQHRFDASSVAVAAAAHGGGFGRVTSAVASVAWWRSQDYYDSGDWRGTWELDGGGALMNQGVHTVDLLVWFLGRPVEVIGHTRTLAHERVEVEDVAVATVRFDSGALAVLHATTAAYPGLSVRIQVHGSRGSAVIDDDQLVYLTTDGSADNVAGEPGEGPGFSGASRTADLWVDGHARQWADVVGAITDGRAPGVTVHDALLALAVVRAVYLSSTLGRPVLVDDVLAGAHDDEPVETGGDR